MRWVDQPLVEPGIVMAGVAGIEFVVVCVVVSEFN
jgi:hypothetical protein